MDQTGMSSQKAADIVTLEEERRRRADPDGLAEALGAASDKSAHAGVDAAAAIEEGASAGEMLAAARQALELSMEEVASRTNIRTDQIAALEKMNVKALPAPTYTLGFVRTYAQLLNLPVEPMVHRFRNDAKYPEPKTLATNAPKPPQDLSPPRQMSVIAVLGIIAFIVWVVWQILEASAPQEEVQLSGTPLSDRLRTQTGVEYQEPTMEVGTSIAAPAISPEDLAAEIAAAEATSEETAAEGVPLPEETGVTDEPVMSAEDKTAPATPDVPLTEETAALPVEVDEPAEAVDAATSADDLNAAQLDSIDAFDLEVAPINAAPTSQEIGITEDGINIVVEEAGADENVLAEAAYQPAELRLTVEPVYPARCESTAQERETVTITFGVSRYGKVIDPKVVSTTNSCFDRAAIGAVSRWDFDPAQERGRTVVDGPRTTRVVFSKP